MAVVSGQLTSQTDGTTAIDTILTQEANRISPNIHRRTLHTSPWVDLIRKEAFPDGMGAKLGTLIYDRALPTTSSNGTTTDGNTVGVNWNAVAASEQDSSIVTASTLSQIIPGSRDTNIGPNQTNKSFVQFSRQFKQYELQRAVVESPRINVEDLRFAAYRTEQLRAVMDALTESTHYTWEESYRDGYDVLCKNVVNCRDDASIYTTSGKEGTHSLAIDYGAAATTANANISNKILDSLYFKLVRGGAGAKAYGRENARPVFAAVLSSEASYSLITEAGFRDDYRYNNAKVGDLIAPLGIERSHRGFYHLIDDLAPRATDDGDGSYTRVYPYTASGGVISDNASYDSATHEVAYILHDEVMLAQIPAPNVTGPGLSFNPVDYKGKFSWKNIPDEIRNPDGTIGFFRGVLARAHKPVKTEFGWAIIFKRTSLTPAV